MKKIGNLTIFAIMFLVVLANFTIGCSKDPKTREEEKAEPSAVETDLPVELQQGFRELFLEYCFSDQESKVDVAKDTVFYGGFRIFMTEEGIWPRWIINKMAQPKGEVKPGSVTIGDMTCSVVFEPEKGERYEIRFSNPVVNAIFIEHSIEETSLKFDHSFYLFVDTTPDLSDYPWGIRHLGENEFEEDMAFILKTLSLMKEADPPILKKIK